MFDFFDNHDECRKSCFIRQKIRSIFSPFWSILRPIWSILTLFNAKALFLALMSEFFQGQAGGDTPSAEEIRQTFFVQFP